MKTPNKKLINASQFGDLKLAKEAVKESANVNCIHRGRTALHWATQEGHLDIVKFLLNKGASANRLDEWGFGPLQQASGDGNLQILKELIKNGANPNVRAKDGGSPLHTASAYGEMDCVVELLNAGAKIFKDNAGCTPRFYAGLHGHKEISLILLSATKNNETMSNKSFLHSANARAKL